MSRSLTLIIVVLALFATSVAVADDAPPRYTRESTVIHGGAVEAAKAGGDTINLMSFRDDYTNGPGEPYYYGDFESAGGGPAWNGWTSEDLTQPTVSHWQVSNYNQDDPTDLAAWCGDINYASCDDSLDPDGGYGNSWHDLLVFRFTVAELLSPTTFTVTADVQLDTEPAYDYLHLSTRAGTLYFDDINIWTGTLDFTMSESVTILPADYVDGTVAEIYLRVTSDGAWSDEDCSWPTGGAVQIDDLSVHVQNGDYQNTHVTDFQDGTLGDWAIEFPTGTGDFAHLWMGLIDLDTCRDNFSTQVAFIDDGQVVPGTGGSDCINWCYGPGGYIVTTTGGLAGPGEHLRNRILSPVMDWPDDAMDGVIFNFEAYIHEDLSADAPGMFMEWGVRSADTDDSGGNGVQYITEQPWVSRNFLYYGGPRYQTHGDDVSDLMNPGRDQVQVMMGAYEIGWVWGWWYNDGYPAPFFDYVRVKVFPQLGPALIAREIDLAQDGFPARGSIDFADLASHSVRFDMARNIAPPLDLHNDPGDSIVIDAAAVRTGAELVGVPRMVYKLDANPVFDAFRGPLPAEGEIDCVDVVGSVGYYGPPLHRWAVDLPDTGFLFPGDVLHYYFEATDGIGGADLITATLPADTTGFSDFRDPLLYDPSFTVRALPTIMFDGVEYHTPPMLFWNDFGNRGGMNEWHLSFKYAGMVPGEDYDIYYTNGPSSGVGNGLGARAGTYLNLEHYTDMFYTCGDLTVNTLGNGDYQNDPSPDIEVLSDWVLSGGKDLYATGDKLAYDLSLNAGSDGLAFAEGILGVSYQYFDLASYIDGQVSPIVRVEPGQLVLQNVSRYMVFGGCPFLSTFDAVLPTNGGERIAQFEDPGGQVGLYPYSAGIVQVGAGGAPASRAVFMPYDFMSIWHEDLRGLEGKAFAPLADRNVVLRDVISYFGIPFDPVTVTDAVPGLAFSARNHPNPFNPVTKIFYTVPKAGHLSLKVFDIRGRLVRTLVDGRVEAGADQVTVWDGRDSGGSAVSSGVYFYEVRTGGEAKVGKMALVK